MIESIIEVVTSPVFLISALTIGYWINLYRKIRRGSDDYWSKKEVSKIVISLTGISLAIIFIGSQISNVILNWASFLMALLILGFWGTGAYIENRGFRSQDNRLSAYGMIGVTSIFWIGIPYFGFVYLPKSELISLENALVVMAIVLVGTALVDFLNIDG
jgi:hypothetical protein